MLRNEIVSAIQAIMITSSMISTRCYVILREERPYLNTVFAYRWIGRRGSIEWPLRSSY